MPNSVFRNIPSVNELLETPALKSVVDRVSHHVVVSEVRTFLDNLRQEIQVRAEEVQLPTRTELSERIAAWISSEQRGRLKPVINATGVLLHTGLGRAPMAQVAIEAMAAISSNYATLEIDAETGGRGQRVKAVEKLLCEHTGAEAGLVVNNNAGATLLTLAAIAGGKEVIVSRGELIEIGGSYRLPDVMSAGGTTLCEVGTTNKTRIGDYENAINEQTAAMMKVHTSNYRIVGFTEAPSLDEMVKLGRAQDCLVIDDIGSGALIDFAQFGLTDEPIAAESIKAGADLVLFSGDKLLGGPQCGIVVGKREAIAQLMAHPLMRALRVGKSTLAALEATLKLYRDPEQAKLQIPLLTLLSASPDNLRLRAERLAAQLLDCDRVAQTEVIESTAQLGGGTVPAQSIPTWCVAIEPHELSVDALATELRLGQPSVFGRIQSGRLLLDLRSVMAHQDVQILAALTNTADDLAE
jgi:L-seryl-tRNA(Ser) seleniumtransferase